MVKVKIEISAHHCHLSKRDKELLFGKNYKLTPKKPLSQTGQFASQEKISVQTPAGKIDDLRVLGPERKYSQVELTKTDCYKLKIEPPVIECTSPGKARGCSMLEIMGPKRSIKRCAAIVAFRHIHCDVKTANKLGLKNKQLVSVKTLGKRSVTFHNVLIRVRKDFVFRMHLDTDEANAAGIKPGDEGLLLI